MCCHLANAVELHASLHMGSSMGKWSNWYDDPKHNSLREDSHWHILTV